jgi:hypothetical protein
LPSQSVEAVAFEGGKAKPAKASKQSSGSGHCPTPLSEQGKEEERLVLVRLFSFLLFAFPSERMNE